MKIDQKEVYLTPDGLGRAAITQRSDNLLNIYTHWIWSAAGREAFNAAQGGRVSWWDDKTPLQDLYADMDAQPGLYQNIDDARSAVKSLPGFSDAVLHTADGSAKR